MFHVGLALFIGTPAVLDRWNIGRPGRRQEIVFHLKVRFQTGLTQTEKRFSRLVVGRINSVAGRRIFRNKIIAAVNGPPAQRVDLFDFETLRSGAGK